MIEKTAERISDSRTALATETGNVRPIADSVIGLWKA
jgi:hypothetical protein